MDLCQNHHHHSRRAPIGLSYMTLLLFTVAFVLANTGGTPADAIFYNNNRTNNEKPDINYDVATGAPEASSSRRAQRDSLKSLALASGRAYNNSNESRKRDFGTIIRTPSASALVAADPSQIPGRSCDFERSCDWKWEGGKKSGVGFQVTTAGEIQQKLEADSTGKIAGPITDAGNGTKGKFLFLAFDRRVNQSAVYHVTSPWFLQTEDTCYLEVRIQLYNMENGTIKLLLTHQNHTVYEPLKQLTHRKNSWDKIRQRIGRMRQPIQVALEITPSHKIPSYVAIDDIRLLECFQDGPTATNKSCSVHEFRCGNNLCISRGKVCDFFHDCPSGEDEKQDCGLMPENTTCSFESGWCAWHNVSESSIRWERRNKPSGSPLTGPAHDHTYGNSSGHYLYVYMNQKNSLFHDEATLRSPLFPPPPAYHHNASSPYYEACQLRFAYHMFGPHMGALEVRVYERNPRQRLRGVLIFRRSKNQGNQWNRATANIPKVSYLYYIEFVASRGTGTKGDIAIDDVSLSPECVGMGVARSELKGYVYAAQLRKHLDESDNMTALPNLKNVTKYEFTTCNSSGRFGPNPEQCSQAYNGTAVEPSIKVLTDVSTNSSLGIQMWTVPETQHYTIIAKGASGGRGAESSQMASRGSIVKIVLYLRRGETLKILVGQEGTSVCDQNFTLPEKIRMACGSNVMGNNSTSSNSGGSNRSVKGRNAFVDLLQMNSLLGGGGGGGGGTFVWKMEGNEAVPLVIAGGGGGLAYNSSAKILPYGRGFNSTLEPQSGSTQPNGAGGGGGWRGPIVRFNLEGLTAMSKRLGTQKDRFRDSGDENATVWISAGESVLDGGGVGGVPCVDSIKWGAQGGFGGGGGGCTAGGGGGGYVGGNAHVGLSANGEGGLSYVPKGGLYPSLEAGGHDGSGSVIIIPSLEGACGCEHHCVLLDDFNPQTACVCAENFILTEDVTCVPREASIPKDYLVGLIVCCLLLLCFTSVLCIYIYNRYQKQKTAQFRRKMLGGPELQLSRIRAQAGPNGVLTEYNPNYEFSSVSSRDLKKIPRENLQLVRSIGQGAFGEVYQGFYKQRANDSVEMPVAVKTLPLLASQQAEEDFLMEAMIMSKFNHANIVHFIGVCDDKHPRFIVLELLAGGDLKTFLRESRPKPEKPSPLTMKDLLMCAMDVAKGCQYLEENHFIHRDIAARNCLLTTKGPGRVVKIADFGMARDIYRADYYKKGGKAMMPVKWMPPEAFLDGIFTSKTDVWSFGVLLWEVFSMGYMPYPGRGNQDVMHLVTHGGRLEPPQNCPTPVYGIMNQCWHPIPEERPKFATLLERLGYCIQDPEVVNAPLPVFQRPPSSERDATLMRPNPDESSCLCITQGPRSSHSVSMFSGHMPRNSPTADYLIPLSPHSSTSSPAKLAYPSIDISVPESASSETLLDDEDGVGTTVTESGNPSRGTAMKTTTATRQQPSLNGVDHEIALNPLLLDDVKRPGPYINVGMSRSDRSDEQIHC